MQIVSYHSAVPNDEGTCVACNQSPTVNFEANGKVVLATDLCGPCYFGTAEAVDPDNWDNLE